MELHVSVFGTVSDHLGYACEGCTVRGDELRVLIRIGVEPILLLLLRLHLVKATLRWGTRLLSLPVGGGKTTLSCGVSP